MAKKPEAPVVERLVDATLTLLQKKTPDDISVAAIAEEAGVSKALLLYHFSSRQALVLAAIDALFSSTSARIDAVVSQLLASRKGHPLRAMLRMLAFEMAGEGGLGGVLLRLLALGTVDDAVKQRLIRFRQRLLAMFSRVLTVTHSADEADTLAELLFAGAIGLEVGRLFADQPQTVERAAEFALSSLDRWLR